MSCKKEEEPVSPSRTVDQVATQENREEALFNKHCILCHRDGKRLQDVKRIEDIVNAMRNPKGSMPKFDEREIPDQEANGIAKFIFLSILAGKR